MLGRIGIYEVAGVIGQGGTGIVLKAFDPPLHRYVAVKVLAPQWATSVAARRRFQREANAAAAVVHPHLVPIHNVDEYRGLPYLVMQYVPGESLQQRLDRQGPLEIKAIVRIGMQVASGLATAHAQGLVHRDIKPANILLENGIERAMLTDFGLARAADDASLTHSGFLAGTPQYMAPEQARGEAVDGRSDLFSLGSVLYAMGTGRPPFRAETTLAVLHRISNETPRPVRDVNPDIPDWLERIINKLHAKRPEDRFQSAAEVAELLEQHLAHLQQPTLAPLPPRVRFRARRSEARRRRFQFLVGAAVLALVAGAGTAGYLLRGTLRRDDPQVVQQQFSTVDETIETPAELAPAIAYDPEVLQWDPARPTIDQLRSRADALQRQLTMPGPEMPANGWPEVINRFRVGFDQMELQLRTDLPERPSNNNSPRPTTEENRPNHSPLPPAGEGSGKKGQRQDHTN
jgi:serine/threonine protein kinase